jgi:hypothetical protein
MANRATPTRKNLPNSTQQNHSFSQSSPRVYDRDVANREVWESIGREMIQRRERQGWASATKFAKAHPRGPNERTIVAIESGRIGHTASLDDYCDALGVTLTDVLAAALPGAEVSADALQIARGYDAALERFQHAVRLILDVSKPEAQDTARATPPTRPADAPRSRKQTTTPNDRGRGRSPAKKRS